MKLVLAAVIAIFVIGGIVFDHNAKLEERRQVEAPYVPSGYDGNNDSGNNWW